tara:strand:- start:1840 stop:3222 length:1383 start_codon:yes stop_codon:yes gene_type:complete
MKEETGSFRDPAGKIFYYKNKIFRKLSADGVKRLEFIKNNLIIEKSIKNNFLVNTRILNSKDKEELNLETEIFYLEHEKIPYISYPYEWSFTQLKEAALFHLDFNLFLLNHNATLIDASAYNVQFIGNKPIFIDVLSLKKYEDGEPWLGHKQFCENFLNPLFLKSKKGLKFNNWFKGNIEGIETSEINKILGFFDKFSYNVFVHIFLLNKIEEKYKKQKSLKINKKKTFLKKKGLIAILTQLRNYISNLKDYKSITTWDNYSTENSYSAKADYEKKKIVENFFKKNNFNIICDLGCNDGEYSEIALKNNCSKVIGFDYDLNAIEKAFIRSRNNELNFLPLFFDASNPSTNLGWNEQERMSFNKRANFDGVIALAFKHHLAIAKNIPLNQVVKWLVSLAPRGLIEYIPKNDITIKKMLELKGDIFSDYTIENFEKSLNQNCNIISKNNISETGRVIYEFER